MRRLLNEAIDCVHPENPTIRGVSHILWTGKAKNPKAHARNAVFYGEKAIDRSPCGTGTSARMAQLHARGELALNTDFINESFIGTRFIGRLVEQTEVAGRPAVIPTVTGRAWVTGTAQYFLDPTDPFPAGFLL
jgi:proline racemase